jgi:hypothetical protein
MDRTKPFTTLARVVATLAAEKPITLPFQMGARNTEWSETFSVGIDRVSQEKAVLLQSTTRKGGVERVQMADACFWSLGGMFEQIGQWSDEDMAHVEALLVDLTPGTSETLDAIASLDDAQPGTVRRIAGTQWTLSRKADALEAEEHVDTKWTLDDAVTLVMKGK